MDQKLCAFWKHDKFPYCLWGEVTEFRLDGSVETKEYGVRHYFHPFLIIPKEMADKMESDLELLIGRRINDLDNLNLKYSHLLADIIKLPKD